MMASVFSIVEAAIADDLIIRFPTEFDFDAMLRKVCEDADVDVEYTPSDRLEPPKQSYKLKGLWLSMEKAYKHLVTTLALYGIRHPDGVSVSDVDMSSENVSDFIQDFPTTNDSRNDRKVADLKRNRRKIPSRKILANSENKTARRPRKSKVQNRKVDYRENIEENSDEGLNNIRLERLETEKDTSIDGPETSTATVNEDNNPNEDSVDDDDNFDGKENNSFEVNSDNKGAEEQKGEVSVETSGEPEKPVVGKRGRPKVYNDDGVAEFPCNQCSFVAKKRAKLRIHMLRMHLSTPSSCDVCNKVFPNKRYMLRHRASHSRPQHCCEVCGKMYKIKKAMLDHCKTHDSSYERPAFKCSDCSKTFCNQYILDCHVRDIHQGLKKSYLCSICGKSFTTKHSLTEHSNAHSGLKPHACEVCGKSFSYESALRDHKFSHMETKNFWCKHCQKGFSQRSGLKMHMRTHRLNKMFVCSECGRGFTQKQALQRHERVHKGEKPFICKSCGRFFTDASIIRRHLILVHKIHKSASTWREDIICTAVANSDHHVQKVGEVEDKLHMIESQKKDIEQLIKDKAKTQNSKGPSRAFKRTYPRRVAILDDDGNIIAPPEIVPPSSTTAKLDFNNKFEAITSFQIKSFQSQSPSGTSIIFAPDTVGGLDATHVLNPRYLDSQQWDAFTSQLSKEAGTHIEHIILDDTGQHDIQKSLDQVQGIHKIIKHENIPSAQVDTSVRVNVLNPGDYQACPSPRSSPVSFSSLGSLPTSQSRGTLDPQFEPLTTQIAHAGGQFYDNRSNNHSSSQWPSMYSYSQLATLGMGINSDYSYINASANGTSSSHLVSPYVTHSSTDGQSGTTTTLILNKDNTLPENAVGTHSHNLTSSLEVVNSTPVSHSLILPQQSNLISERQLQVLKMDSVSADETIHSAEIILHQGIPNLNDEKTVDISVLSSGKSHELIDK